MKMMQVPREVVRSVQFWMAVQLWRSKLPLSHTSLEHDEDAEFVRDVRSVLLFQQNSSFFAVLCCCFSLNVENVGDCCKT